MSTEQFKKHRALFEGFWGSEETAQEIINSLGEEDVNNLTSDEIYRLVDEFVEMGDSPHAADRDEIAQIIMDRMGVYNDEENVDIDLNDGLPSEEDSLDDYEEVDYGDGMHDRENEDPEVYIPSSRRNFESFDLTGVVAEMLNEMTDLDEARGRTGGKVPSNYAQIQARKAKAARLAAIKKAAKKAAPADEFADDEDEFAAPEKVVDVGDAEDYEFKNDDVDFNEIGLDVDFDDRDDFGGWR
jgi:hypothetical protein